MSVLGRVRVLRFLDQLRPMMGRIDAVPLRLVRTIGVLAVLGALGLILPPLTGIAKALALAAAAGLVLIQVGGISLLLSRSEAMLIGLSVALLSRRASLSGFNRLAIEASSARCVATRAGPQQPRRWRRRAGYGT
jgi:hypothetical protein